MIKVVCIGLDGADWKILNPMIQKGYLPFIKNMRDKSIYGNCVCPIPPLTASSWTTFQTGVNPGKHGIFGFINYRDNNLFNSSDVRSKRVWQYLADSNRKSMTINLPFSGITGLEETVASFISPGQGKLKTDTSKYLRKIKYENDFFTRSLKEFPENLSEEDKDSYLDRLVGLVEMKMKLIYWLWEKKDYQFMFILIRESDLAQHLFMDDIRLVKFWKKLDRLMEKYISPISGSDNSLLTLVSDHGFTKSGNLEICPYKILNNEKYIQQLNFHKSKNNDGFTILKGYLKRMGLGKIKLFLINREKERIKKEKGYLVTPEGIYLWGKDKRNRAMKIVKIMKNQKIDGEKVFINIDLSSRIYKGKNVFRGPDIVWMTKEGITVNTNPFGRNAFSNRKVVLPGEHTSNPVGMFLMTGKMIRRKEEKEILLADLVPTLLDIFNCPYDKKEFDGNPLKEGKDVFYNYVKYKIRKEIGNVG